MQKKLNLSLYKNLLDSQFFVLDKQNSVKKNIINSQRITEEYLSGTFIHTLNLPLLVGTVKQLLRTLMLLKSAVNAELHILVDDSFQQQFIKNFFNTYPILVPVKINSLDLTLIKKESIHLLLDLRETADINLLLTKISSLPVLVFRVNSEVELAGSNYYKMYNQLNESNKLVFFLILIHSALTKQVTVN
jgi:hypothetical protein